jgi:hypothetical protein
MGHGIKQKGSNLACPGLFRLLRNRSACLLKLNALHKHSLSHAFSGACLFIYFSQSHTLTFSLTHSSNHPHNHELTHSQTHKYFHSRTPYTHAQTHPQTPSQTHRHPHKHTLTLTNTQHAYAHTHTHTLIYLIFLSLFHCTLSVFLFPEKLLTP